MDARFQGQVHLGALAAVDRDSCGGGRVAERAQADLHRALGDPHRLVQRQVAHRLAVHQHLGPGRQPGDAQLADVRLHPLQGLVDDRPVAVQPRVAGERQRLGQVALGRHPVAHLRLDQAQLGRGPCRPLQVVGLLNTGTAMGSLPARRKSLPWRMSSSTSAGLAGCARATAGATANTARSTTGTTTANRFSALTREDMGSGASYVGTLSNQVQ